MQRTQYVFDLIEVLARRGEHPLLQFMGVATISDWNEVSSRFIIVRPNRARLLAIKHLSNKLLTVPCVIRIFAVLDVSRVQSFLIEVQAQNAATDGARCASGDVCVMCGREACGLVLNWCLVQQTHRYHHYQSGRHALGRVAVECWCKGYIASCFRQDGSPPSGSCSDRTRRIQHYSSADTMAG